MTCDTFDMWESHPLWTRLHFARPLATKNSNKRSALNSSNALCTGCNLQACKAHCKLFCSKFATDSLQQSFVLSFRVESLLLLLAPLALQRRSISISLHCRPSPFGALFSSTSSIQRALLHLLLLFDRYTATCVILPIRHPSPSAPARTHAAAAQVIVYSPAPQPPTLCVTFTIQPRRGAASHPRPEEFKR